MRCVSAETLKDAGGGAAGAMAGGARAAAATRESRARAGAHAGSAASRHAASGVGLLDARRSSVSSTICSARADLTSRMRDAVPDTLLLPGATKLLPPAGAPPATADAPKPPTADAPPGDARALRDGDNADITIEDSLGD